MKPSQSEFLDVRGLKLHIRCWGSPGMPVLFMLHGAQDVSASWQFTVDALARDWHVIAPDWRGYGLSARSGADTYWFPDYLGDLDALLEHYCPERPARIVAHSMGANAAGLYAGARPDRVESFINVDGFGIPRQRQDPAARRLGKWLAQLGDDTGQRPYESFDEFAIRMQSENPRLTDERARFIVQHWGQEEPDGTVVRRADPAHKRINPQPMPPEEMFDCWKQTRARVLWVHGAQSGLMDHLMSIPGEFERRAGAYNDLLIERVDDCGHNVHHDQPEQLAALVESFV